MRECGHYWTTWTIVRHCFPLVDETTLPPLHIGGAHEGHFNPHGPTVFTCLPASIAVTYSSQLINFYGPTVFTCLPASIAVTYSSQLINFYPPTLTFFTNFLFIVTLLILIHQLLLLSFITIVLLLSLITILIFIYHFNLNTIA